MNTRRRSRELRRPKIWQEPQFRRSRTLPESLRGTGTSVPYATRNYSRNATSSNVYKNTESSCILEFTSLQFPSISAAPRLRRCSNSCTSMMCCGYAVDLYSFIPSDSVFNSLYFSSAYFIVRRPWTSDGAP